MQKWKVHLNKTIAVPGSPTWDPSAFSSKYWKSVEKVKFCHHPSKCNIKTRSFVSFTICKASCYQPVRCTPTIDVLTNVSKLYRGVKSIDGIRLGCSSCDRHSCAVYAWAFMTTLDFAIGNIMQTRTQTFVMICKDCDHQHVETIYGVRSPHSCCHALCPAIIRFKMVAMCHKGRLENLQLCQGPPHSLWDPVQLLYQHHQRHAPFAQAVARKLQQLEASGHKAFHSVTCG
jgi:hypothetical protein